MADYSYYNNRIGDDKMIKDNITVLLIILLGILIVGSPKKQSGFTLVSQSDRLLLGSTLNIWGLDSYWGINSGFHKSAEQRAMANGVIGTFRFEVTSVKNNPEVWDLILNDIESVNAVPMCVLPVNDDAASVQMIQHFGNRVTMYEYGNEVGWFLGISPEEHAQRFCAAWYLLKSANPTISIGGPTEGSTNVQQITRFMQAQKQYCPEVTPDFISYHKYFAYSTESDQQIMTNVANFGNEIEAIRAAVIGVYGVDLPHVISEWNYHAVPENYGDNRDCNAAFIQEFTRQVLNTMKQHNVYMAHQYCYGDGCGDHHLDMINYYGSCGNNNAAKPMYAIFQEYATNGFPYIPPYTTTTTVSGTTTTTTNYQQTTTTTDALNPTTTIPPIDQITTTTASKAATTTTSTIPQQTSSSTPLEDLINKIFDIIKSIINYIMKILNQTTGGS